MTRHAANPGHRRNEYDRCFAGFAERGQGAATKIIGCMYVYIECFFPLLRRTIVDFTEGWTTSRMHKNIQSAEARLGLAHQPVDVLRPGHIGNDRNALAASRCNHLSNVGSRRIVMPAVNRDVATLAS